MFEFLHHEFNPQTFTANFYYRGADQTEFCEKIVFEKTDFDFSDETAAEILNRALDLAHLIIGTSYYKAHPTTEVATPEKLDTFQANFFNKIYQEGLSQYAYENNLTRDNLAHFKSAENYEAKAALSYASAASSPRKTSGVLVGQSGGKDSLLVAKLLPENSWTAAYISSTETYPEVLNHIGAKKNQTIIRKIDRKNLQKSGGMNGHVPVTYINMAIMLIQAILNGDDTVLTSIGHEGAEPHAKIGDLEVNHQWSKTWEAEQLFTEYVHRYISEDLKIGSPLRQFSELKIAELFVKNCWSDFGHKFSSCNVANYKQGKNNQQLSWCGNCAKCANSYLLFAPFLPPEELNLLFPEHKSLLEKPELFDDFKGLLGVDGAMKPFECIGEVAELQKAYAMKQPEYKNLPFSVPSSDFDYEKLYPAQKNLAKLIGF